MRTKIYSLSRFFYFVKWQSLRISAIITINNIKLKIESNHWISASIRINNIKPNAPKRIPSIKANSAKAKRTNRIIKIKVKKGESSFDFDLLAVLFFVIDLVSITFFICSDNFFVFVLIRLGFS